MHHSSPGEEGVKDKAKEEDQNGARIKPEEEEEREGEGLSRGRVKEGNRDKLKERE